MPIGLLVGVLIGTAIGVAVAPEQPLTSTVRLPSAGPSGSGPSGGAAPGASSATSGASGIPASPSPAASGQPTPSPPSAADYVAPPLARPLRNLDPGLATRDRRPTAAALAEFQSGLPLHLVRATAGPLDWRLARPSFTGVRGYAGVVSVAPGGVVPVHLAGADRTARLDVFRMGVGDATHLATVTGIPLVNLKGTAPQLGDGRVEEDWPVSYRLAIPRDWRSGYYLVKLTGSSGRDSYISFVVRATARASLMVVLPVMTYQAYNAYGGSSLYAWTDGPQPRAYAASFDRPYADAWGAGLFMRLDFPLVVWLEDHGYAPAYVSDYDVALRPSLIRGAKTLIFTGHGEYWTGALRDTVDAVSAKGTSLAFFGANQAFWQSRLVPSSGGDPNRVLLSYKSARLDPIASTDPGATTTRFQEPPVNRPPSDLMGLEYGGVVMNGLQALVVGPGITRFAPDVGLKPGDRLPGLIGGEIDSPPARFEGLLLGQTPVTVRRTPSSSTAASAVWIRPSGGRVFDAGTFDWAWGLDPRYAAAMPGFPADAFAQLNARILAWLGAQPGP